MNQPKPKPEWERDRLIASEKHHTVIVSFDGIKRRIQPTKEEMRSFCTGADWGRDWERARGQPEREKVLERLYEVSRLLLIATSEWSYSGKRYLLEARDVMDEITAGLRGENG
jgi:hypothetical protein